MAHGARLVDVNQVKQRKCVGAQIFARARTHTDGVCSAFTIASTSSDAMPTARLLSRARAPASLTLVVVGRFAKDLAPHAADVVGLLGSSSNQKRTTLMKFVTDDCARCSDFESRQARFAWPVRFQLAPRRAQSASALTGASLSQAFGLSEMTAKFVNSTMYASKLTMQRFSRCRRRRRRLRRLCSRNSFRCSTSFRTEQHIERPSSSRSQQEIGESANVGGAQQLSADGVARADAARVQQLIQALEASSQRATNESKPHETRRRGRARAPNTFAAQSTRRVARQTARRGARRAHSARRSAPTRPARATCRRAARRFVARTRRETAVRA